MENKNSRFYYLSFALFWSWNIIFLAFMVLGFAPRVLPELVQGVRMGTVPWEYLVYGTVLSLIPVACVILGATVLRGSPRRLVALGYVVEGPLMLLLVVRFFVIRQATLPLTLLLVVAGAGMMAFLWYLLDQRDPDERPAWLDLLRLAGLTLMLMVALYAAVWTAFYAVPLLAVFVRWFGDQILHPLVFLKGVGYFFRDLLSGGWVWIPFVLLGFLLTIYTATLFVFTPIAVPILSVRAWWRSLRSLAERVGWLFPAAMALLVAAVIGTGFVFSNYQPQQDAFALLKNPPQTVQEAQALLEKDSTIRAGLLNAYLAPYRYISSAGEVAHVSEIYKNSMSLSDESAAEVERWYDWVAQPLLYRPVEPTVVPTSTGTDTGGQSLAFDREPRQAARLYQRFYDVPIVEAERPQIVSAVRQSWSTDQIQAAWQAVDEREVLLEQQSVTVNEHGDWADVEIMEMYRNQTLTNQEVIYYFNLPETSVLTGLWLGLSPDKSKADVFQVAPRGAAQQIYREETVQRRDPALLEQIGPRQYRLRAFPVPPMQSLWNYDSSTRTINKGPALYLWMTYSTVSQDGTWPLPQLAFHRNVYWDRSTSRSVNGQALGAYVDAWLPGPLVVKNPVQPAAHRMDFENGQSVIAQPASEVQVPALPEDVRLAVVLDRSRSMEAHAGQAATALARLKELAQNGAAVDVYLTSSSYRGEQPAISTIEAVSALNVLYFGGQNPADLLAQFNELSAGKTYDGILVLTDGSAYELGPRDVQLSAPDAPLWMIHLGSDIPLGYDDPTLEAIQASGGGVVGSLEEALTRLAAGLALASGDLVDGYAWTVVPTAQADALIPAGAPDGFAPLLARRLILAEIHNQRGAIGDTATLDTFHALAQQYGIVTPYSSMIVLVNDVQRARLENLSEDADRFKREYEGLTNTAPPPGTPLTGVPEPEEWLLMISAALLLAWYVWKNRSKVRLAAISK